ncbi:hypothetical protein KP509_35G042000 [Ceratopteris richardii]|uniref:monodehydroascorbate reductase (NADH) n=1 Tax=Ceratopteris richardii TaxID=49495 RepID=A0A8T2QGA1_CERRI|nr:hypothetical protein KP509_35G042000 [Ceratopteris richardii]
MAIAGFRHGVSLWCPQSCHQGNELRFSLKHGIEGDWPKVRRSFTISCAANADLSKDYVIVGGGNAAGYAVRAFTEHGVDGSKICIVSKEKVPPYERPALTKAYLFPLDKSPARLPGFHTCVGTGNPRQTDEWYKDKGIQVLYDTAATGVDLDKKKLFTSSGSSIAYDNLIIATGASAARLPKTIGGDLQGVHYIREVADADALIEALQTCKKLVVIGGGYIGMEVAAAATAWKLDTTMVFPEPHIMPRLFTPSIADKYEDLFKKYGVRFTKGVTVKRIISGHDGKVSAVELSDGVVLDADTVVVGIGAKPAVGPFIETGLKMSEGGIEVDGQFRTSSPNVWAIGDVAAFPLKIYNRITRVEHVDHARKSAQHCVESLLKVQQDPYDYLPYFYSRVFEHPGSERKVWWQFYGDNVGDVVEVGDFSPKYAAFWIQSGVLKGVFLESGSPEEFGALPKLARQQPKLDVKKLQSASKVEDALSIALEAAGIV